jgi:hypothetical protein
MINRITQNIDLIAVASSALSVSMLEIDAKVYHGPRAIAVFSALASSSDGEKQIKRRSEPAYGPVSE